MFEVGERRRISVASSRLDLLEAGLDAMDDLPSELETVARRCSVAHRSERGIWGLAPAVRLLVDLGPRRYARSGSTLKP